MKNKHNNDDDNKKIEPLPYCPNAKNKIQKKANFSQSPPAVSAAGEKRQHRAKQGRRDQWRGREERSPESEKIGRRRGWGSKTYKRCKNKEAVDIGGGEAGRVFIELFGARVVEWRNSRIQYRNFLFLPSKGQTFFFFCVRKKKKLFYLKKFLFWKLN